MIVYALMESQAEKSKCSSAGYPIAWYGWSSMNGKSITYCTSNAIDCDVTPQSVINFGITIGDQVTVVNSGEPAIPLPTANLTPTPTPISIPDCPITVALTAQSSSPGTVTLSWNRAGSCSRLAGWKVVESVDSYPVYPTDSWKYVGNPTAGSYTWNNLTSGDTYHFRIGAYLNNGVIAGYSNDVYVLVE